MKKLSLLLIFYLALFTVVNCSKKKKWEGKKEVKNGTLIISNPVEGLWEGDKTREVNFIEKLSIGLEEGDTNYVFAFITDVETDSKGNIYVLDRGNHRIQKFSPEGRYILTIGREGKGPGEFISPSDMDFDDDDNLFVLDPRVGRVSMFDPQGAYKGSFNVKLNVQAILTVLDGNLILAGESREIFNIVDRYGNLVSSFGKPVERPVLIKNSKVLYMYITSRSKPSIFWRNGYLFYSQFEKSFDRYEIRKYDTTSKLLRIVYRSTPFLQGPVERRIQFSRGVADAFLIPNSLLSTIILNDGKILNFISYIDNFNFVDFKKTKTKYMCDIFDKDGRFLTSFIPVKNGYGSSVDRDGNLYFIQVDPFPKVIKYEISFK